jgi:heme A synthase
MPDTGEQVAVPATSTDYPIEDELMKKTQIVARIIAGAVAAAALLGGTVAGSAQAQDNGSSSTGVTSAAQKYKDSGWGSV